MKSGFTNVLCTHTYYLFCTLTNFTCPPSSTAFHLTISYLFRFTIWGKIAAQAWMTPRPQVSLSVGHLDWQRTNSSTALEPPCNSRCGPRSWAFHTAFVLGDRSLGHQSKPCLWQGHRPRYGPKQLKIAWCPWPEWQHMLLNPLWAL